MTDEDAVRIARQSGYGPIVKLADDDWTKPHGVIVVDMLTTPPTVTRIEDEYPNLREPTP